MAKLAQPSLTTVKKHARNSRGSASAAIGRTTPSVTISNHTIKHVVQPDAPDDASGESSPSSLDSSTKDAVAQAPLTPEEESDFEAHIEVIRKSTDNDKPAAISMFDIRNRKLYRGSHKTWRDFCRDEFDMSEPRATQLIKFGELIADLTAKGVDAFLIPTNERAAREVRRVEDSKKVAVLKSAYKLAGKTTPTSSHIAAARAKLPGASVVVEPKLRPIKIPTVDRAIQAVNEVKSFLEKVDAKDLGTAKLNQLKAVAKAIGDKIKKLSSS